jgi:hypothetical protein
LLEKLPEGIPMSETLVNETLSKWHTFGDCATLRREMFERGLLERTIDCREYIRVVQREKA